MLKLKGPAQIIKKQPLVHAGLRCEVFAPLWHIVAASVQFSSVTRLSMWWR